MRRTLTLGLITLTCSTTFAQDVIVDPGVPQVFGLCYQDNVDSAIAFACSGVMPLYMHICFGQMEPCCDLLYVYDGLDTSAPLLFAGNNNGDLTDFVAISSNLDQALTCRIVTNGSVSCASQGYVPLVWSMSSGTAVGCDVGVPSLAQPALRLAPNPTEGLLNVDLPATVNGTVQVDIIDAHGQLVMAQQRMADDLRRSASLDLRGLAPGMYSVRVTAQGLSTSSRVVVAR
jgi:Secretion system C-terminal sorting domain